MKSLEFIGPPGSGKSFYTRKLSNFLKKEKINFLDLEINFYENFPIKFILINFILLLFILKKKLSKKDNYFIRLSNYYFDKIYDFNHEFSLINDKVPLKKFTKEYFENFEKYEKRFRKKKNEKMVI